MGHPAVNFYVGHLFQTPQNTYGETIIKVYPFNPKYILLAKQKGSTVDCLLMTYLRKGKGPLALQRLVVLFLQKSLTFEHNCLVQFRYVYIWFTVLQSVAISTILHIDVNSKRHWVQVQSQKEVWKLTTFGCHWKCGTPTSHVINAGNQNAGHPHLLNIFNLACDLYGTWKDPEMLGNEH